MSEIAKMLDEAKEHLIRAEYRVVPYDLQAPVPTSTNQDRTDYDVVCATRLLWEVVSRLVTELEEKQAALGAALEALTLKS